MERSRIRTRTIIGLALVFGLLLGASFAVGYTLGLYTALNWGVEKANYYLKAQGENITIDSSKIVMDLWRYKERIGECASITK